MLRQCLLDCLQSTTSKKETSTQTDLAPLIHDQVNEQSAVKRQSSLETALQLVQRAVDADKARRYEDALQMYQHALVYFLESINYETESDKVKEKILGKCKQYLDRAEKIAEYLATNSEQRKRKLSAQGSKSTTTSGLGSGHSTCDVSRTGSSETSESNPRNGSIHSKKPMVDKKPETGVLQSARLSYYNKSRKDSD